MWCFPSDVHRTQTPTPVTSDNKEIWPITTATAPYPRRGLGLEYVATSQICLLWDHQMVVAWMSTNGHHLLHSRAGLWVSKIVHCQANEFPDGSWGTIIPGYEIYSMIWILGVGGRGGESSEITIHIFRMKLKSIQQPQHTNLLPQFLKTKERTENKFRHKNC